MSSANLIIRDATEHDREAYIEVLLASYGQYAQELAGPRWDAYKEALLSAFHEGRPIARIAAFQDGKLVGSVQLFTSSEEAYGNPDLSIHNPIIRYLAVDPSARDGGIATALIRESIRRARALGATRLNLHTSDMMASAVRLYERLGFERAFETDIYNGETLVKGYRLELNEGALLL